MRTVFVIVKRSYAILASDTKSKARCEEAGLGEDRRVR